MGLEFSEGMRGPPGAVMEGGVGKARPSGAQLMGGPAPTPHPHSSAQIPLPQLHSLRAQGPGPSLLHHISCGPLRQGVQGVPPWELLLRPKVKSTGKSSQLGGVGGPGRGEWSHFCPKTRD